MERRNCWEEMQCGREPGGANVNEFGVCPAAISSICDGINSGTRAGRICWAIAGTMCHGEIQGTYAKKLLSCLECPFMQQVHEDESQNFVLRPTCLEQQPCFDTSAEHGHDGEPALNKATVAEAQTHSD